MQVLSEPVSMLVAAVAALRAQAPTGLPDGQALAKALDLADLVAANGPLAVQAILRTIRDTEAMAENDAFKVEAQLGMAVFASDDAKEGPRAFAEKRRPDFRGQ